MYHGDGACFFPCKAAYDLHRNLPSSLPVCIIRDASRYVDCDDFEEKPDTDDTQVPGGHAPLEAAAEDEAAPPDAEDDALAPGGDAPDDVEPEADKTAEAESAEGFTYKQDAIGRWYKYDRYGNRVFNKPLRGSLRPPSIPYKAWTRLGKSRSRLSMISGSLWRTPR